MLRNLYKMFIETDATLVEINPLAETPTGEGAFTARVTRLTLRTLINTPCSHLSRVQCSCATPS